MSHHSSRAPLLNPSDHLSSPALFSLSLPPLTSCVSVSVCVRPPHPDTIFFLGFCGVVFVQRAPTEHQPAGVLVRSKAVGRPGFRGTPLLQRQHIDGPERLTHPSIHSYSHSYSHSRPAIVSFFFLLPFPVSLRSDTRRGERQGLRPGGFGTRNEGMARVQMNRRAEQRAAALGLCHDEHPTRPPHPT